MNIKQEQEIMNFLHDHNYCTTGDKPPDIEFVAVDTIDDYDEMDIVKHVPEVKAEPVEDIETEIITIDDNLPFGNAKMILSHSVGLKKNAVNDTCCDCGKTFLLPSRYRCGHCKKCFVNQSLMFTHIIGCQSGVSKNDSLCKNCYEIRIKQKCAKELETKLNSLVSKKNVRIRCVKCFKCDECRQLFKTDSELQKHKITHLQVQKNPLIKCVECGNYFNTQSDLIEHKKDVHFKLTNWTERTVVLDHGLSKVIKYKCVLRNFDLNVLSEPKT